MFWRDITRWAGTGTKIVVAVVAVMTLVWLLMQMRDRRRKQASQVTVERQRIHGSWNLIVYVPGEAPIRRVVAVMDDGLDDGEEPPMLAWVGWAVVVGDTPYTHDLNKDILTSILPLTETYFTDVRGKHWRIDAKDHSLHRERRSIYSDDPTQVTAELQRRRSSRSQKGWRSLAGKRHRVRT